MRTLIQLILTVLGLLLVTEGDLFADDLGDRLVPIITLNIVGAVCLFFGMRGYRADKMAETRMATALRVVAAGVVGGLLWSLVPILMDSDPVGRTVASGVGIGVLGAGLFHYALGKGEEVARE